MLIQKHLTVNDAENKPWCPFPESAWQYILGGCISYKERTIHHAVIHVPPNWVPFCTFSAQWGWFLFFCYLSMQVFSYACPSLSSIRCSLACIAVKICFVPVDSSYPWVKQFSVYPTLLGSFIRKTSQYVSLELNRHLFYF